MRTLWFVFASLWVFFDGIYTKTDANNIIRNLWAGNCKKKKKKKKNTKQAVYKGNARPSVHM